MLERVPSATAAARRAYVVPGKPANGFQSDESGNRDLKIPGLRVFVGTSGDRPHPTARTADVCNDMKHTYTG